MQTVHLLEHLCVLFTWQWESTRKGHHFRDTSRRNMIDLRANNLPGELEVDSGELKLLIDPVSPSDPDVVHVRLYETFGPKQRQFIDEKKLYLSRNQTKWCEFDLTDSAQWWLNDKINSKLELVCSNCKGGALSVREAFVNALVFREAVRMKRSVSPFDQTRRTDCRYTGGGSHRMKCCRHNMTVTFKDLRFPEMASIVQPKSYEAGYCQGRCPPNYNYATNHSRIQTLVHQMDKKVAKQMSRRAIPKACCSPSKLAPLEIIRVDPYNTSKLIVEKWENMQVTECACS
ncbi:bone morphogenetic protein 7-like isoform X2 [Coccinella septempunctata]|uniref:bone morphogenetic protein 7-like isoform X2 n=1 Tax=Coccinella septempunctata TaxID=41139 RepID=UPI001D08FA09|nr:bone morphogenetic protein 7-like isoform X2 [Coccinella septempunctata]